MLGRDQIFQEQNYRYNPSQKDGWPVRVLVTGATGFLGMHVLSILTKRGYEVHAVSRSKMPLEVGIKWHCIDLLDKYQMEGLIRATRPSHLLHLAWITTHSYFWEADENELWENATGTLATLFQEMGGRRLVVSGSCAEYNWEYGVMKEYLTPLEPLTKYGRSKLGAFRKLTALADSTELSFGWGRIFHLYGPNEHPDRLVAYVARSLLMGEPVNIGRGSRIRNFMYAQDAADALVRLLESGVTGPVNIASELEIRIDELVQEMAEIIGGSCRISYEETSIHPNDPECLIADITRLRSEVGYLGGRKLCKGLIATIEWWKNYLEAQDLNRILT